MTGELIRFPKCFSWSAALISIAVGALVLISWMFEFPSVFTTGPSYSIVLPNVALGFIASGLALFYVRNDHRSALEETAALVFCGVTLLLGIEGFVEAVSGRELFFNQLVLSRADIYEHSEIILTRGGSALSLVLISLGLVLVNRQFFFAQIVLFTALAMNFLAIGGHAYRVLYLAPLGPIAGTSLLSAVAFSILAVGALSCRPNEGILRYLLHEGGAGILVRRMVTFALFLPLILLISTFIVSELAPRPATLFMVCVSLFIGVLFLMTTSSTVQALDQLDHARARAEADLVEKEERLSEAQRVARVGSWEWDLESRKFILSAQVARLLGLPHKDTEVSYQAFLNSIHPEDREWVQADFESAAREQRSLSNEHRMVRPDGIVLWVQAQAEIKYAKRREAVSMLGTAHDITERKETEEALRKSERLLKLFVESMPVGVFTTDRLGRILTINQAGKTIWGSDNFDQLSQVDNYQAWWESTGEKITREKWASYIAIQEGRSVVRDLVRIQGFDGTKKVILNSAVPIRDESDEIVGSVVVNEDVTALRETELALQEAEKRMRGYLENAHEAVITVAPDGRIEFANHTAEAWFGYNSGELLNRPIESVLPDRVKGLHPGCRADDQAPTHDSKAESGDHYGVRKDGTEFPIEIALSPVASSDGLHVTAMIRDMTERREIEADQRYLNFFSRELAGAIDAQTVLNRVTELVVPYLCDWYALIVKDENGGLKTRAVKHVNADVDAELKSTLEAYDYRLDTGLSVASVMRTGQPGLIAYPSRQELEAFVHDPVLRAILIKSRVSSVMILPLKVQNKIFGSILMATGPSGRILNTRNLFAAEEIALQVSMALENARLHLESKNAVRAREDVVSIVSHDLRNPLGAIQVSAEMQLSLLEAGGKPEHIQKMAKNILNSADTMNSMIRNILDLGKIQAGTFAIDARRERLRDLFSRVDEMFAPLVERSGVKFVVEPVSDNAWFLGDTQRLMQVLSNLIGNAMKFTPRGGAIEVRAVDRNKEWEVCVRDTGAGIPRDQIPHLFTQYWQGRVISDGAGLGLFIARGIVEAHSGRVWVESEVGRGSAFYFTIPKVQKQQGIEYRPDQQAEREEAVHV